MTPLSRELLGPVAAGAVACGTVVVLASQTSLDGSVPGVIALMAILLTIYGVLELGVVGISPMDRTALRLAIRPGS
jgi:hypothetical protein